jgi:hypothetical protein
MKFAIILVLTAAITAAAPTSALASEGSKTDMGNFISILQY